MDRIDAITAAADLPPGTVWPLVAMAAVTALLWLALVAAGRYTQQGE